MTAGQRDPRGVTAAECVGLDDPHRTFALRAVVGGGDLLSHEAPFRREFPVYLVVVVNQAT